VGELGVGDMEKKRWEKPGVAGKQALNIELKLP
jgi:hypothetical protein